MRSDKLITFGEYTLDERNECLWRGGESIALRPKAFAILKYLLEHAGQLVTKQQLLDAVWSDSFVGDAVLKDSIRQLRDALEDDAKEPRYIETLHRRGYRFIAQIAEDSAPKFNGAGQPATYDSIADSNPEASAFKPVFNKVDVVGREEEMARLRSRLENMLRGERQVIFITGEPGIGKTTLVEAFLQEVSHKQNIRITRGQCLEQYGEGEAYLPVLEAISLLGREGNDRQRFIEILTRYAPTWLTQIPSLKTATNNGNFQPDFSHSSRERMLREIAEALEAITLESPLILLLEDLHWSDYSTLDLVSYLARRREPARLMVIGTYRPVEVIISEHPLKGIKRELQVHRLCRELPLEYLTEDAVREFLEKRFSKHQFPNELSTMIHQRTEGNPLFMVNVIDYLVDEGIIVQQDGIWQERGDLSVVQSEVPENIRQLIERQIERLSAEEQRILEAASVVGIDCSAIAISAAMAEDVIGIEEICDRLARNHQFLLPAYLARLPDGTMTPRYKFIHVLYLDVLYKRISPTRRSLFHSRIGERGEEIYGNRVAEIATELAVHFEQARDIERAVKYFDIAIENALHRFAKHEAASLTEKRLQLTTGS